MSQNIRRRTDQETFWAERYAADYMRKNASFDNALALEAWRKMLASTTGIRSVLECGCNIGRNISSLDQLLPSVEKSIIEISKPAFDYVSSRHVLAQKFHGSILESGLAGTFDLVFTMGVLIHIHPDLLLDNLRKIVAYSHRYVLIGEYFNRTPTSIEYQGEANQLFKRDFGRLVLENFPVRIIEYGFLWGYVYDPAGFDDITWWLFEKA